MITLLGTALPVIFICAASWAVAGPAVESKVRIAFAGDSTADGLWGGVTTLVSRGSCWKGAVELGRYGKNSTGLTRPEKYDWPEEARKIAEGFKPELFVVSLGLNDRQSVVDRTEDGVRRITPYEAPEFPDRYRERVTAMLKGATVAKASVLWVGLAAMRERATNADIQLKNKIFAHAVAEFGVADVQYVPPWRLNDTGEDVFTSYAPDRNGKMIHIRATDGEHFTSVGDELVAAYVFPRIVASLGNRGIDIDRACPIVAQ
jgi:hypothetical protein